MRQLNMILIAAAGCLLLAAANTTRAQNTVMYVPPEPKTRLEALENRIGTILIKATSPMGTISASKGVLSVTCKEDKDVGGGLKEYGIAIGIAAGDKSEDAVLLDHDELDSLLNAIDYLSKVDWAVTSLPSFSASYETKGGFRIAVFVSKRTGNIEIAVRNAAAATTPVWLTRQQLSEFRLLIEQSRKKLDDLAKEQKPGEPRKDTDQPK